MNLVEFSKFSKSKFDIEFTLYLLECVVKRMSRLIDLTGQRFGRLVVLERAEDHVYPSGNIRPQWSCRCECGNEIIAKTNLLRNGHTRSCGCLHSDVVAKFNSETKKRFNRYDLSLDDYGVGYDCNGEPFYFDKEDYDLIKNHCWHIHKSPYQTNKYVVANITLGKNLSTAIKMHRLIMGYPDGMVIDHINHDGTDNRKANLRIVTQAQNAKNMALPINNSSGKTGVSWDRTKQVWVANIRVHNKQKFLGYYNDINEAIIAREKAEEKYYGEFSYANSMKLAKKNNVERIENNG